MPLSDIFSNLYNNLLGSVVSFVLELWWIPAVFITARLAHSMWLFWRRTIFRQKIKWTLLEILIPREIRKSPKAMEQIFDQMATMRNSPGDWYEKYIQGEVTRWFSFEVASFGGDIHFFIRTPIQFKNIVESFIYANYRDVEVVETADYTDRLPSETRDLYKAGMEMFGMQLKLSKDAAYPIRTYLQYEAIEEEKALDPLSALIEELSRVKREETIWLQIVARPADSEWQKKGDLVVKELKARGISKAKVVGSAEDLVTISRSPGETATLETIEKNLAKSGFDVVIRSLYFAPRSIFNIQLAQRGIRSLFNQYSGLNRFSYNMDAWTLVKWIKFPFIFTGLRAEARKQALLYYYRKRAFPEEMWIGRRLQSNLFFSNNARKALSFVLNTEALATLFHPPSFLILTSPFIKQVEAKRMGPPAGLPIFGEGEDLPGLEIPGKSTGEKK